MNTCLCPEVALRDGGRLDGCSWSSRNRARASTFVISRRVPSCECVGTVTLIFIDEEMKTQNA